MSLPLAHALVGASLSIAVWPEDTPGRLRLAPAIGALLGMCPDADYLFGRLHVLGWGWHHGVTHSIAFAVIVGAIVARCMGAPGWRGALACVLPVLSHPLLDYLVTESPGVALLWPVTSRRYKLGIDELSYYYLARASGGVRSLARLCGAEVLLFGPMLAFSVLHRRAAGAAAP